MSRLEYDNKVKKKKNNYFFCLNNDLLIPILSSLSFLPGHLPFLFICLLLAAHGDITQNSSSCEIKNKKNNSFSVNSCYQENTRD